MSAQLPFDPRTASANDSQDALASFRDEFHLPRMEDGSERVYFVGNSLGLMPKQTAAYVDAELQLWKEQGVDGHFSGDHPWMPYHEFLAAPMARIVGASEDEVVVMNSLTANLHLMLTTFYRPQSSRHQILIEEGAFPSDHFAVESHLRCRGQDPNEAMVIVASEPDGLLSTERICQTIEDGADKLALVLLPGVQYYTGQWLDMPQITKVARQYEIPVGFDLAHAAGNVPLALHDWGVDFAVWCTYKYLNSGPGSLGGCFVHRDHATNTELPRLAGWWGQDKQTRFQMRNEYVPIPTAEGWQLSNPAILSMAAIRSALDVFDRAGGISVLRAKSEALSGYFDHLLTSKLGDCIRVLTPKAIAARGCQLSLQIRSDLPGKEVFQRISAAGLVTDWREPDVIRAAPVPLYNSFRDVERFVDVLKRVLDGH